MSEMCDALAGLEGRIVSVRTLEDERREFDVGRSDGWMPHHLEIYADGRVRRADLDYAECWVKGEDY